MKKLLIALVFPCIIYLVFFVFKADPNPLNWPETIRLMYVVISIASYAAGLVVVFSNNINN